MLLFVVIALTVAAHLYYSLLCFDKFRNKRKNQEI